MDGRKFGYKELASATNNFSSKLLIGEGGFGQVYRGFLKDVQLEVAIKRCSQLSPEREEQYISEIRVLGQLNHKNLVPFVGYCKERRKLLLVYKFMPNMSLDYHLFSEESRCQLDWRRRYTIVLGLASALLYLHDGLDYCIVHRDINPSNVLLDNEFNARVSDFGIARHIDRSRGHVRTLPAEIVCGRRSLYTNTEVEEVERLPQWVWNLREMGKILDAADKRLDEQFDKKEMECLLVLGLWCSHPHKESRPNARQVIGVLNFETHFPTLPLTMPVPMYSPSSDSTPCISKTSSYGDTDSFRLPESLTYHTQMIDEHPQTSIRLLDKRSQTTTSEDNVCTRLPRLISADEHQVGSSAPTITAVHEGVQGVGVEIALAKEEFDIGISINYRPIGPLQSYQLSIIQGYITSLQQILKSDPAFHEVVDYIKIFTSTLTVLGTPLNDWNSLAQYILRVIKEIDNLKLKMEGDSESSTTVFSFILDRIELIKRANEEDAYALEISHQRLHRAIQEHTQLQRQLKHAQDACFSILKEVNDIETRRANNQTRVESLGAAAASATEKLQLKEEYKKKIAALSTSMLSKITSFSFDV